MAGHTLDPRAGSSVAQVQQRITEAGRLAAAEGWDALLITPGPDLRYLAGYDAVPLERLTCLVVPAQGDPILVAPLLERAAAAATPVGEAGVEIRTWGETDDPYALVADLLPGAARVGVDDHMWAVKALSLRSAMPTVEQYACRDLADRGVGYGIPGVVVDGNDLAAVLAANVAIWVLPVGGAQAPASTELK